MSSASNELSVGKEIRGFLQTRLESIGKTLFMETPVSGLYYPPETCPVWRKNNGRRTYADDKIQTEVQNLLQPLYVGDGATYRGDKPLQLTQRSLCKVPSSSPSFLSVEEIITNIGDGQSTSSLKFLFLLVDPWEISMILLSYGCEVFKRRRCELYGGTTHDGDKSSVRMTFWSPAASLDPTPVSFPPLIHDEKNLSVWTPMSATENDDATIPSSGPSGESQEKFDNLYSRMVMTENPFLAMYDPDFAWEQFFKLSEGDSAVDLLCQSINQGAHS